MINKKLKIKNKKYFIFDFLSFVYHSVTNLVERIHNQSSDQDCGYLNMKTSGGGYRNLVPLSHNETFNCSLVKGP